jgi:hypothetical protein
MEESRWTREGSPRHLKHAVPRCIRHVNHASPCMLSINSPSLPLSMHSLPADGAMCPRSWRNPRGSVVPSK